MGTLFRAVVAVTRTKRRRYLWCAWWTGEPTEDPFRPPDAWSGGARTEAEALREAERAAGVTLTRLEGRWAGAWLRVRSGQPPFVTRAVKATAEGARPVNPRALLGVTADATLDEVKAAFRALALRHHPDHGGEAAAFIALKRAYDSVVKATMKKRR